MSKVRRAEIIEAAIALFREHGYHGTSMRDLGRELGLLGSSLYSHIDGKQSLLVEVVDRGAAEFQASVDAASEEGDDAVARLRALIAGHIGVVLDHRDEVRTYLNEASALDEAHRSQVIAARDQYEAAFRDTIEDGIVDGSFRPDVDSKTAAIFILSILNAIDRWYRDTGPMDRAELTSRVSAFILEGIDASSG